MLDRPQREPEVGGRNPIPRRRFLVWTATTAALAAVYAACKDVLVGPSQQPETSGDQSAAASQVHRLESFAHYPAPAYVPPGYELLIEQDHRPDGFRGSTGFGEGILQVALVYRGPRAPRELGGTRYPLVFSTTREAGYHLAGTEHVDGLRYPLRFEDGSSTTAIYYDGMWEFPRVFDEHRKVVAPPSNARPVWNRVNEHALVYEWEDFTVGVRGSRLCGVSFDELVKIAASTTIPTL